MSMEENNSDILTNELNGETDETTPTVKTSSEKKERQSKKGKKSKKVKKKRSESDGMPEKVEEPISDNYNLIQKPSNGNDTPNIILNELNGSINSSETIEKLDEVLSSNSDIQLNLPSTQLISSSTSTSTPSTSSSSSSSSSSNTSLTIQ